MSGGGHTWHENQLVPITRRGLREDVYWTYSYGPIDDPGAPKGIGGVLVVCTETTEQVLAEQRLRDAEARWRSLFEQSPGFVSILSGPDHVFEFANQRYFDLVGGRELIGKPAEGASRRHGARDRRNRGAPTACRAWDPVAGGEVKGVVRLP